MWIIKTLVKVLAIGILVKGLNDYFICQDPVRGERIVDEDYDTKLRLYSYGSDLSEKERIAIELLKSKENLTLEEIKSTPEGKHIKNIDDWMEVKYCMEKIDKKLKGKV